MSREQEDKLLASLIVMEQELEEQQTEIERLRARLDETRKCPACKQAGDPFCVERTGMCTFCANRKLDDLSECRRLLREACEAWPLGVVAYPDPNSGLHRYAILSAEWYEAAEAAGGGDDEI